MKRKVTMLAMLIATMAPTAIIAKTADYGDAKKVSSRHSLNPFSISAIGEGIVQLGHHHPIGLILGQGQGNFSMPQTESYEVSFELGSESSGGGIIKIGGTAIVPGQFYEFTSEEMDFEFQGMSVGTSILNIQVRNSAGEIESLDIEVDVKSDATTWNGSAWSSGLPDLQKHAIINGSYSGGGFSSKTLQVNRGALLTIEQDGYVTIDGSITNFGEIVCEDKSTIIQVDDDAINVGEITYKRNTAPVRRYDFTYWGSPVSGETLYDLSPETLWDKYYSWNAELGSWTVHVSGDEIMEPGKGYIVRAPQDYSLTEPEIYNAEFKGIPNNGTFYIDVKGSDENVKMNLLSNPYPSALDADLFMNHPDNAEILGGTILLWSHTTLPSSDIPGESQFNYSSDDYAKFNATGGIKTASAQNGGVTPTGKIASGQGFFIEANSNTQVMFNNSMRASDNSQFFRMANATTSEPLEKHRVWLKASNPAGAYDETLIGFIENATDDVDRSFDGKYSASEKAINIYSFINEQKFTIQGKAIPEAVGNQIVNLGYKSMIAGVFSIDIEAIDGLFTEENRPVYLDDSITQISHNLKNGPYNFSTAVGTFDNRFKLRIPFNTLSSEFPESLATTMLITAQHGKLTIDYKPGEIEGFSIYDLAGRNVMLKSEIKENHFSNNHGLEAGIYIIRVTTDSGIVTKKIYIQ